MALKKQELTSRETPEAMQERMFEAKLAAMEKAMKVKRFVTSPNETPRDS